MKGKVDLTSAFSLLEAQITDLKKHFTQDIAYIEHNFKELRKQVRSLDGAAVVKASKPDALGKQIEDVRKEILDSLNRLENMGME